MGIRNGIMGLRVLLWSALLLPVMASAVDTPAPVPAPTESALSASTHAQMAGGKNPDPWEKLNRSIFHFNDVADRYALKPVAKGYRAITPAVLRTGVTNFFLNLRAPLVVMNDLLQGKLKQAGSDTLRFVVNSTVGVAGFIDVGTRINLPQHDEDFGQTLGKWGVASGPYLMLPFFGPSTVRDSGGLAVDFAANPRRRLISDTADWALFGVDVVNSRAGLLDLEDIVQGDRYLFIRDLYLQRRDYAVKDGVVEDPFLDEGSWEDEPAAAAPAGDAGAVPAPEATPLPEPAPVAEDSAAAPPADDAPAAAAASVPPALPVAPAPASTPEPAMPTPGPSPEPAPQAP